jgi:hypothetical protein
LEGVTTPVKPDKPDLPLCAGSKWDQQKKREGKHHLPHGLSYEVSSYHWNPKQINKSSYGAMLQKCSLKTDASDNSPIIFSNNQVMMFMGEILIPQAGRFAKVVSTIHGFLFFIFCPSQAFKSLDCRLHKIIEANY